MLSYDEWNNLLNNTILFYQTLNQTIYQRRQAYIKAHPSGSIDIELPVEVKTSAILEWSSDNAFAGYFIPKSPFITKAGLHQTEEEKRAHQDLVRKLTASLNR